jgi:hypothetical protein
MKTVRLDCYKIPQKTEDIRSIQSDSNAGGVHRWPGGETTPQVIEENIGFSKDFNNFESKGYRREGGG